MAAVEPMETHLARVQHLGLIPRVRVGPKASLLRAKSVERQVCPLPAPYCSAGDDILLSVPD